MNSEIIYDLLKEVREEQRSQLSEQQKQSETLIKLSFTIKKNTEDIANHISRTKMLEDLYKSHNNRIDKLEEPIKYREWLYKHWGKSLTVLVGSATFFYTVIKIVKAFGLL